MDSSRFKESSPGVDIRLKRGVVCLVVSLILSGCSVEYFDASNGVEHVWGLGHVAMKIGQPNEGLKAVGYRTDSVGLAVGKAQEGYQLGIGWSSYQRLEVADQDAQMCLAWPAASFYTARVGTKFPPDVGECGEKNEVRKP